MGHAYQKYLASISEDDLIVPPLLKYPTFEIAEIFSYAIELMVLPELATFFSNEDYQKYCYLKIRGILGQLPYIALVDHFQQKIYSNTNYTSRDYHQIWNELAELYGNKTSNSGHPNLEAGNYFFRQNHIFLNPFYYIDYGLSYFGSLALWQNFETDKKEGLRKYHDMAKEASNIPLLAIIDKYNLPNPFEEDSFIKLTSFLERKLDEYDQNLSNKTIQKKIEYR